jgi:hypothetical protein
MMGKGSKPGGTFDSGDSIERIVGRLRRRLQTHPEIRDAVSPIFENGELRRKALCWEEAASKLTTLFESNPTSDGMDVELFFLHLCVIGLARRRQLLKGLSDLGPCGTAAWSRDAGWTRKARSLWAGSHLLMLYLGKRPGYCIVDVVATLGHVGSRRIRACRAANDHRLVRIPVGGPAGPRRRQGACCAPWTRVG